MDALHSTLAAALEQLYLECRAMRWNGMADEMQTASAALDKYREEVAKIALAAIDAQRDIDAEPQPLEDLLVLVVGDPANGYRFIGPFNDMEDASSYASSENDAWSICDLDPPEQR